jgi:DNA-directed RNA polymerase specialized sigma24 family protein
MSSDSDWPLRSIFEDGDPLRVRQAVAQFAIDNSAKIRAIARRKLTKVTRTVHDSEDVLSSVLRRLDTMAEGGNLRPRSEQELWGLITVIARNCAVSRTRLIERAKELLTEDGPLAYEVMRRLNACRGDEEATILLRRMMAALPESQDRQIFDLQFRGATHGAIAGLLGISPDACRHRWMAIRRKLAEWFAQGGLHD